MQKKGPSQKTKKVRMMTGKVHSDNEHSFLKKGKTSEEKYDPNKINKDQAQNGNYIKLTPHAKKNKYFRASDLSSDSEGGDIQDNERKSNALTLLIRFLSSTLAHLPTKIGVSNSFNLGNPAQLDGNEEEFELNSEEELYDERPFDFYSNWLTDYSELCEPQSEKHKKLKRVLEDVKRLFQQGVLKEIENYLKKFLDKNPEKNSSKQSESKKRFYAVFQRCLMISRNFVGRSVSIEQMKKEMEKSLEEIKGVLNLNDCKINDKCIYRNLQMSTLVRLKKIEDFKECKKALKELLGSEEFAKYFGCEDSKKLIRERYEFGIIRYDVALNLYQSFEFLRNEMVDDAKLEIVQAFNNIQEMVKKMETLRILHLIYWGMEVISLACFLYSFCQSISGCDDSEVSCYWKKGKKIYELSKGLLKEYAKKSNESSWFKDIEKLSKIHLNLGNDEVSIKFLNSVAKLQGKEKSDIEIIQSSADDFNFGVHLDVHDHNVPDIYRCFKYSIMEL